MPTRKFNGVAVAFGNTNLGAVQSVQDQTTCAEIDATGAGDTEGVYEAGIPRKQISITCKGTRQITPPATGVLTITYPDNTNMAINTAVCLSADQGGEIDGVITTSYTFRKANT